MPAAPNINLQNLPESIQKLVQRGVQLVRPQKVVLFGSRARGDHRENSDFDIAFAGLADSAAWNRFLAEYSDEALTLRKVDLIVYETASDDYRKNIDSEGVTLYER